MVRRWHHVRVPDSTVQRLADIERALLGGIPLADCLRMCLALGTDIRSARLRQWAQRELNGYRSDDDLPAYRTVGAALHGDIRYGPLHGKPELIERRFIPAEARDHLIDMNGHDVRDSIAEVAAIVARANQLSSGLVIHDVPDESRLRVAIERNVGHQKYSRIYWAVAAAAYEGLLDRVRTAAVSIVTEVRMEAGEAQRGADGSEPLSAAADQAVALHVSGSNNQIHVNQAGRDNAGATPGSAGGDDVAKASLGWTRRQTLWTIASFAIALAGIVITVLAR